MNIAAMFLIVAEVQQLSVYTGINLIYLKDKSGDSGIDPKDIFLSLWNYSKQRRLHDSNLDQPSRQSSAPRAAAIAVLGLLRVIGLKSELFPIPRLSSK